MPISPSLETTTVSEERDNIARCLLAYLKQLPMGMEKRLELTLEVLRELPVDATPDDALKVLLSRLPTHNPTDFPPSYPSIKREHMPSQYMGRARTGARGFISQWGWGLTVALLLLLTLLLSNPQ